MVTEFAQASHGLNTMQDLGTSHAEKRNLNSFCRKSIIVRTMLIDGNVVFSNLFLNAIFAINACPCKIAPHLVPISTLDINIMKYVAGPDAGHRETSRRLRN